MRYVVEIDNTQTFKNSQQPIEAVWHALTAAGIQAAVSIFDGNTVIPVQLNIFDDNGMVDATADSSLTINQVSDIVDHASQLVLFDRNDNIEERDRTIGELEEALVAASVISEEPAQRRLKP